MNQNVAYYSGTTSIKFIISTQCTLLTIEKEGTDD
jgi:hypothetical protein